MQQALDWIYSADVFDAAEASRGGLVKAVYPADQLLTEAHKLAIHLARERACYRLRQSLKAIRRSRENPNGGDSLLKPRCAKTT
jgi:enoyl-CoA hydratase/carnithine racemase